MKKLFTILSLGLLVCATSYGQQSHNMQTNITNENAVDKSVISGHFEMNIPDKKKGITEHINVNYTVSPAPFTQFLNLELNTAEATMFSADVVDASGAKKMHWAPAVKSNSYKGTMNIAQLVPGEYMLNIYSDLTPELLYTITFRKEK